mmetsp:Transcript_2156/g.6071  ORF Transcript_2156/g.6071 Transcript_2156/m.6071 type:complete len:225 (-) Transcript_2156:164-838(-)
MPMTSSRHQRQKEKTEKTTMIITTTTEIRNDPERDDQDYRHAALPAMFLRKERKVTTTTMVHPDRQQHRRISAVHPPLLVKSFPTRAQWNHLLSMHPTRTHLKILCSHPATAPDPWHLCITCASNSGAADRVIPRHKMDWPAKLAGGSTLCHHQHLDQHHKMPIMKHRIKIGSMPCHLTSFRHSDNLTCSGNWALQWFDDGGSVRWHPFWCLPSWPCTAVPDDS